MISLTIYVLIVYLIYFTVTIRRFDKDGHYKNKKKKNIKDYDALPSEVKFFVIKYKVDLNKVNLRAVLKLIGLLLALEIVVVMLIVSIFVKKTIGLQILLSTLLLFPIYLISLKLIAMYFKKKGWLKNV